MTYDGPPDGTVYQATDGKWYRWPNPTPYNSEADAEAGSVPPPAMPPPPPAWGPPTGPPAGLPNAPTPAALVTFGATEVVGKPWYKKKRYVIPAVLALFIVIGAITSESEQKDPANVATRDEADATTAAAVPTVEESPTPPPPPPTTTAPKLPPAPKRYSGSGDDVITIQKPDEGTTLVYAKGNAARDNFVIAGLDATNEQTDLLVNVTDPYEGVTLLDARNSTTTALRVEAVGAWVIELRPLLSARSFAGLKATGSGDDVLFWDGNAGVAAITGNAAADNFVIKTYTASDSDLLVNEIEPYSGRVPWPAGPAIVEIQAVGPWSITYQ